MRIPKFQIGDVINWNSRRYYLIIDVVETKEYYSTFNIKENHYNKCGFYFGSAMEQEAIKL